ncbi:hypothetical protein BJX76DRAFT_197079 [Aspergillus varians]
MAPVRRVIGAEWIADFLQYILDQDRSSTILIVCAARDSFIAQMRATMHLQSAASASHHRLLTKTLGQLSSSRNIRTVFCPTLEHLRAYLSTGVEGRLPVTEDRQRSLPLLAILNPLSLHLSTREFSAQGLSRTFANAVEVSSKTHMDVVLCECRETLDPTNTDLGEALWSVDVPLINSSRGVGTEGDLTGQAVPVKQVAQRWFQFTDLSH